MRRYAFLLVLASVLSARLAAQPFLTRSIGSADIYAYETGSPRVDISETLMFALAPRFGMSSSAGFSWRGSGDWMPRLGIGGFLAFGGLYYVDALYRLGYALAGDSLEHRAELGITGDWAGNSLWLRGVLMAQGEDTAFIGSAGLTAYHYSWEGALRGGLAWSSSEGLSSSGRAEARARTIGPLWLKAACGLEKDSDEARLSGTAGLELRFPSFARLSYGIELPLYESRLTATHSLVLDLPLRN